MSTMTPKIVMFRADVENKHGFKLSPDGESTDPQHMKLEEMINELSSALTNVKHEQEYMEVRSRVHREINANTNSRVVMWSCFEAVVLLAMTIGQVYYLKRFFEVRRIV